MDTPTDSDGEDSADDTDASKTPSSRPSPPQPLTATKWNVRVVVVPSAAQTFRWSCVCLTFTLCCVLWSMTFYIERLGHFRICFVVRVAINFVYVGNNLVWNRIHCVCNFHRMVCFLLTFDAFWFCVGFFTRSVSVTCIFSCLNLLQHIKYYQFLYVFGTAIQHPFLFLQHWYHRRSIATGLAFSTHLYNGPAFSSPAFSTSPCKMVSCFPVPRFQSSHDWCTLPLDGCWTVNLYSPIADMLDWAVCHFTVFLFSTATVIMVQSVANDIKCHCALNR